jgi:hypothetical protein
VLWLAVSGSGRRVLLGKGTAGAPALVRQAGRLDGDRASRCSSSGSSSGDGDDDDDDDDDRLHRGRQRCCG